MVHLIVGDAVDQMADGSTFEDTVGAMVDRTVTGLFVFEKLHGVDAWAIVLARRQALFEKYKSD